MTQGILYVVFGKEYEQMATTCMKHSRKNTDLPFHVLTNIRNRSIEWNYIKNVTFQVFDMPTSENRHVKTTAIHYTPFDETLMIDADSVIQHEPDFTYLDEMADIVLNRLFHWKVGDKIVRLYANCFKQFYVSLPIDIYNGAFIMFKQNMNTVKFFELWHKYWVGFGKGREMPCLASAVQKSGIHVRILPFEHFAPEHLIPHAVVQHMCKGFNEKFATKTVTGINRLDPDASLWNWVEYENYV